MAGARRWVFSGVSPCSPDSPGWNEAGQPADVLLSKWNILLEKWSLERMDQILGEGEFHPEEPLLFRLSLSNAQRVWLGRGHAR
jgi:hypothetical protein